MNKKDEIDELEEHLKKTLDENPLFFTVLLIMAFVIGVDRKIKEEKGKKKDE